MKHYHHLLVLLQIKIKILVRFFIVSIALFMSLLTSAPGYANTPHLDFIQSRLMSSFPGSQQTLWPVSYNNRIVGYGDRSDNWLLQTPDCWGDAQCANSGALQRYTETIRADIARAQHWVDITTLVTYPDGVFQQAIVAGLKAAHQHAPQLQVRILGGTPPVMGNFNTSFTETAHAYMKRLKADLGPQAEHMKISVAGVETSWLYSWNHSKIIAVDGRSSIVGGHNMWESAYGQVANPISDLTMRLEGDAALSAHRFADLLWAFTCRWQGGAINKTFYVDLVSTAASGEQCPAQFTAPVARHTGDVAVMALGGLGFGMDVPGGLVGGLADADDRKADCSWLFADYVNESRDYTIANPEEEGLRALIASANQSVFISQQDLIAPCAPPFANSYYDARLFDVLADQLNRGVKVQIVVSTPGAKQSLVAPYSNMKKMTEITDILLRKLTLRADLSASKAKAVMCQSLQLAPLRHAPGAAAWANGNTIANHAKTVSVDGQAFYIGSKNLYPATLQDFGYIVEDSAAAAQYYLNYQLPMWENSRSDALVDYQQNICI